MLPTTLLGTTNIPNNGGALRLTQRGDVLSISLKGVGGILMTSRVHGSEVALAEFVPEVIEWNKGPLGECAGRPLDDDRVEVHLGDVAELFKTGQATYDAVLLDVDNGPESFTHADNNQLYSGESLQAIQQTLKPGGVLAIWSARHDPVFTQFLKKTRLSSCN